MSASDSAGHADRHGHLEPSEQWQQVLHLVGHGGGVEHAQLPLPGKLKQAVAHTIAYHHQRQRKYHGRAPQHLTITKHQTFQDFGINFKVRFSIYTPL